MKEITKKRTIEENYTVYEATDGTEFTDFQECQKYEKSALGVLMVKYKKLVTATDVECSIFWTGSDENAYDIVKVDTQEDADIIMQIMLLCNPHLNEDDNSRLKERAWKKIQSCVGMEEGNRLLVYRGYGNDEFCVETTYLDVIANLKDKCFKKDEDKAE